MFGLFANGVGQTMLFSVLAPIASGIGLSEIQVGIVIATSAATTALISPFWERQADRVGRKTVFVFGLLMYGITTIIFGGILSLALGHSISPLLTFILALVCRICYASLVAGLHPAAMAFTATITTEERRASGMALVAGAYSGGSVAGPIIGGFMTAIALVFPIYVGGCIALIAGVLAWRLLPSMPIQAKATVPTKLKLRDRRIIFIFLSCIFYFICFAILQQTMPFYLQKAFGLDAVNAARYIGLSMTALALSMVLAQIGFVSWLKWPPTKLLTFGCSLTVTGLCMFLLSKELFEVVTSHVIVGFGFGMIYPSLQAAASMAVDTSEQGAAAGIMGTAAALGYVAGPLLGTGLFSVNSSLPFFVAIGAVVASLVVYFLGYLK